MPARPRRRAMDYAVDVLGWDDIIHTIDPANRLSIRLAERLGSANRGPTRLPPPVDGFTVDAWGQSAAEWRARGGRRRRDPRRAPRANRVVERGRRLEVIDTWKEGQAPPARGAAPEPARSREGQPRTTAGDAVRAMAALQARDPPSRPRLHHQLLVRCQGPAPDRARRRGRDAAQGNALPGRGRLRDGAGARGLLLAVHALRGLHRAHPARARSAAASPSGSTRSISR